MREYVEGGGTGDAPLIIEFDRVVRSYLYDLYDHVDDHSKGIDVDREIDATVNLEEGISIGMPYLFADKKLKKKTDIAQSEFFLSDLSLLHFTVQFLFFQVKDSLQLMRKSERLEEAAMSKQVVLRNILKCLELDRLLLYTYNAMVFDRLKNSDVVYEKESLRFVTLCFFKRAFLIM